MNMSFYDGFQLIYDEIRMSCISRFIVVGVHRRRSPLVSWKYHQVREGPQAVENGEVESPPPPLCLYPPLHCPLPRIWAQRECPPPAPLPPPGQRSNPISFASVPVALHCRHGWPPASPHPQVRWPAAGHYECTRDPTQEHAYGTK
jgi:hypothetical protein